MIALVVQYNNTIRETRPGGSSASCILRKQAVPRKTSNHEGGAVRSTPCVNPSVPATLVAADIQQYTTLACLRFTWGIFCLLVIIVRARTISMIRKCMVCFHKNLRHATSLLYFFASASARGQAYVKKNGNPLDTPHIQQTLCASCPSYFCTCCAPGQAPSTHSQR